MKYFTYPLKKEYEKQFILWPKTETIKYSQATIRESQEFFYLSPKEQVDEVGKIIISQITNMWSLRIFKENMSKRTDFFEKIIWEYIHNRFRNYKSIFEWILPPSKKKSIYQVTVKSVCSEYNISWPEELFSNYTQEQFDWMVDWLIFSWNELDKKTSWYNVEALTDREWVKMRLEKNKKAFQLIK